MPTIEEEIKKCSARRDSLEKKMEQNGFTAKQISLLHDYGYLTGLELAVWAQHKAKVDALKSKV
jgi:hypothetical protein